MNVLEISFDDDWVILMARTPLIERRGELTQEQFDTAQNGGLARIVGANEAGVILWENLDFLDASEVPNLHPREFHVEFSCIV